MGMEGAVWREFFNQYGVKGKTPREDKVLSKLIKELKGVKWECPL